MFSDMVDTKKNVDIVKNNTSQYHKTCFEKIYSLSGISSFLKVSFDNYFSPYHKSNVSIDKNWLASANE
jgi:hypothetical protein